MFKISLILLLLSSMIILFRVYKGPTLYDRVVAANSFGTLAVLMIGVVGFLRERPDFLDIALLYALINFIGTIAVLKFFRYKMIDSKQTDNKSAIGEFRDDI